MTTVGAHRTARAALPGPGATARRVGEASR